MMRIYFYGVAALACFAFSYYALFADERSGFWIAFVLLTNEISKLAAALFQGRGR